MKGASPLRYPGGKWRWERYFARLLSLNQLSGAVYVEAYAGGASLALSLLFSRLVSEVYLNDLDRSIFAFWYSVIRHNREFVKRVLGTPITVREWEKHKLTHNNRGIADLFELGFATFFLNRTNRSGVLNGGVIGGKSQTGEWGIDARFNRDDLVQRLRRVGEFATRVHVTGDDALGFLDATTPYLPASTLVYLDPPYYEKGQDLYLNAYKPEDHAGIRKALPRVLKQNWVVSYDDVRPVRKLYSRFRSRKAFLQYSARESRKGREILLFSDGLRLPRGGISPDPRS